VHQEHYLKRPAPLLHPCKAFKVRPLQCVLPINPSLDVFQLLRTTQSSSCLYTANYFLSFVLFRGFHFCNPVPAACHRQLAPKKPQPSRQTTSETCMQRSLSPPVEQHVQPTCKEASAPPSNNMCKLHAKKPQPPRRTTCASYMQRSLSPPVKQHVQATCKEASAPPSNNMCNLHAKELQNSCQTTIATYMQVKRLARCTYV